MGLPEGLNVTLNPQPLPSKETKVTCPLWINFRAQTSNKCLIKFLYESFLSGPVHRVRQRATPARKLELA